MNSPNPSIFLLYSYLIATDSSLNSFSESLNCFLILLSKSNRSCKRAYALSELAMMEPRAPVAKENAHTPMNMRKLQKTRSMLFIGLRSPYPTVVTVVAMK